MKTLLTICALLVCVSGETAYGQDPTNAGFESWNSGTPTGWITNNIGVVNPVTQSTDAHGGSYAAQGTVVQYLTPGTVYTPVLELGVAGTFVVTTRYSALHGWYKFPNPAGAVFNCGVLFYSGTYPSVQVLAGGSFDSFENVTVYKEFVVSMNFLNPNQPSSASITFGISDTSGDPPIGASFLVDDLSWGAPTDVAEAGSTIPKAFGLEQNYPNPFNPSTTIVFEVPRLQKVTLAVYNILGQRIAALVDDNLSPGKYKVVFEATSLPSGTYFYRLETPGFTQVRKLSVVK